MTLEELRVAKERFSKAEELYKQMGSVHALVTKARDEARNHFWNEQAAFQKALDAYGETL